MQVLQVTQNLYLNYIDIWKRIKRLHINWDRNKDIFSLMLTVHSLTVSIKLRNFYLRKFRYQNSILDFTLKFELQIWICLNLFKIFFLILSSILKMNLNLSSVFQFWIYISYFDFETQFQASISNHNCIISHLYFEFEFNFN